MGPTVRHDVFDAYWYFAAERQRVFDQRARRSGGPWTDDPILRQFKFCNTFRASDRVSQYLISEVIYGAEATAYEPEDVFLRIVLFRLFSKESTWNALEEATGGVCRATLNVERLGALLDELRVRGPIYTAAFILCAHDAYGYRVKHRNHLELVQRMFAPGQLGRTLGQAASLREVYEALREWPMIGPFMGYQLAVDLNYSDQLNFDENDFTVPGPGAVRGLHKVFTDFAGRTPQQLIMGMVERQDDEFARLAPGWDGLFGRPLHAIDCQGLFCEVDKYSRQAFPELKSNRVRIKQEFRDPKPPLDLFYPPKWQINERVAAVQQRAPGGSTERQLRLVDGDLDTERVSATAPRVDGLPLDLFDASTAFG
jgi:hypothetical protein